MDPVWTCKLHSDWVTKGFSCSIPPPFENDATHFCCFSISFAWSPLRHVACPATLAHSVRNIPDLSSLCTSSRDKTLMLTDLDRRQVL